jgi:hypothetical protein
MDTSREFIAREYGMLKDRILMVLENWIKSTGISLAAVKAGKYQLHLQSFQTHTIARLVKVNKTSEEVFSELTINHNGE